MTPERDLSYEEIVALGMINFEVGEDYGSLFDTGTKYANVLILPGIGRVVLIMPGLEQLLFAGPSEVNVKSLVDHIMKMSQHGKGNHKLEREE